MAARQVIENGDKVTVKAVLIATLADSTVALEGRTRQMWSMGKCSLSSLKRQQLVTTVVIFMVNLILVLVERLRWLMLMSGSSN